MMKVGMETLPVTAEDIDSAAARIASYVHRTPLLTSASVSDTAGVDVRLKCENLQRAGAFKIRGAANAVLQLSEEQRSRGVVAFSSGNHAQGVALAARILGIRATIVMPEGSVQAKVAATSGYGATVVQAGVSEATRGDVARSIVEETGATLIPPFDHPHIIAGAGTVGREIIEEWPEVRNIFVPLGGGGLLAGIAVAVKSRNPAVRIYGVEPAAGNDGQRSFRSGSIVRIDPPRTIADGAKTTSIGLNNFAIIKELVTDILTIDDDELLESLRFAVYRTKLVMEPTGALGLTALLRRKVSVEGPSVAVISGGNLDLSLLCR